MKNELRKTVLAQLTSQDPETKAKIDQYLLEQLIALPAYKDAQVIATYLSFPHEYDTSLLINQALKDGKRLLIPKTYKQGRMIFVDYDPFLSDFEGETVSTVYPCQKHDFQPDSYDIPVKEVVTCK